VDVTGPSGSSEARYLGSREKDAFAADVFALRVKGEVSEAATCHGRWDKLDLRGEMVLRSADLALVSLDLEGRDDIVEDVCDTGGTGRKIVGRHVADSELHLAAPCFARAVVP
jgi:hypothetical protein